MTLTIGTREDIENLAIEHAVEALRITQELAKYDELVARRTGLGQTIGWLLTHELAAGLEMDQIVAQAQSRLEQGEPKSEPTPEVEPEKPKRRRRTKAEIEADKAAEAAKTASTEDVVPGGPAGQTETIPEEVSKMSGQVVKDEVEPTSDEDADAAWAEAAPKGPEYDPFATPVAAPETGREGGPLDPFATAQPAVQPGAPAPWEQPTGAPVGSPFD